MKQKKITMDFSNHYQELGFDTRADINSKAGAKKSEFAFEGLDLNLGLNPEYNLACPFIGELVEILQEDENLINFLEVTVPVLSKEHEATVLDWASCLVSGHLNKSIIKRLVLDRFDSRLFVSFLEAAIGSKYVSNNKKKYKTVLCIVDDASGTDSGDDTDDVLDIQATFVPFEIVLVDKHHSDLTQFLDRVDTLVAVDRNIDLEPYLGQINEIIKQRNDQIIVDWLILTFAIYNQTIC